jgi:predicted nucleotidyltransferase
MTEEQLDLFEDSPANAFYIHDVLDEFNFRDGIKFPIIGFQNFDFNGRPYMEEADLKLFAEELRTLVSLHCTDDINFEIVWGEQ